MTGTAAYLRELQAGSLRDVALHRSRAVERLPPDGSRRRELSGFRCIGHGYKTSIRTVDSHTYLVGIRAAAYHDGGHTCRL